MEIRIQTSPERAKLFINKLSVPSRSQTKKIQPKEPKEPEEPKILLKQPESPRVSPSILLDNFKETLKKQKSKTPKGSETTFFQLPPESKFKPKSSVLESLRQDSPKSQRIGSSLPSEKKLDLTESDSFSTATNGMKTRLLDPKTKKLRLSTALKSRINVKDR